MIARWHAENCKNCPWRHDRGLGAQDGAGPGPGIDGPFARPAAGDGIPRPVPFAALSRLPPREVDE
jgi:hypothetical protein